MALVSYPSTLSMFVRANLSPHGEVTLFFLCHRQGNGDAGKLSSLSPVVTVVTGGMGIRTYSDSRACVLNAVLLGLSNTHRAAVSYSECLLWAGHPAGGFYLWLISPSEPS